MIFEVFSKLNNSMILQFYDISGKEGPYVWDIYITILIWSERSSKLLKIHLPRHCRNIEMSHWLIKIFHPLYSVSYHRANASPILNSLFLPPDVTNIKKKPPNLCLKQEYYYWRACIWYMFYIFDMISAWYLKCSPSCSDSNCIFIVALLPL